MSGWLAFIQLPRHLLFDYSFRQVVLLQSSLACGGSVKIPRVDVYCAFEPHAPLSLLISGTLHIDHTCDHTRVHMLATIIDGVGCKFVVYFRRMPSFVVIELRQERTARDGSFPHLSR
jgi:hypothetical protein